MLRGQIVEAGTFTQAARMTRAQRAFAQAMQNFAPVEVAYSTCYDGADQRTAKDTKTRKLKVVDEKRQELIDRDAGGRS
jgi:hypothetical protein